MLFIQDATFVLLNPKILKKSLRRSVGKKEMDEEIEVTEKNKAWELVERLKRNNVIGIKWVYKEKHISNGSFKRNKARLVVNGYAQHPKINYDEIFVQTSTEVLV